MNKAIVVNLKFPNAMVQLSRMRQKTAYGRHRLTQKMALCFSNPKSWNPPKRRKKVLDVKVVSAVPHNKMSHDKLNHLEQMRVVGAKYRRDLMSLFASGYYSTELSSIFISKVILSPDNNDMKVLWQQTSSERNTKVVESQLIANAEDIQSRFNALYPKSHPPVLKFEPELMLTKQVDDMMESLDLGEDDSEPDTGSSSKRQPEIRFIQNIYGLDRALIISKLGSAPASFTSFGVIEKTTEDNFKITDSD